MFSRSVVFDSLRPHEPQYTRHQVSLSITVSWSLLKLISTELVMPSNHLILCRPLLLLPSIFPSIRVFSNESVLCIRWTKYWSFSFSINLSNEYSGLISFRMDWLDLLVIQGTLKSLLQGLPWWLSGKEPACQCQKHRFDPRSGKIPHAAEQLSPCPMTVEPVRRARSHK